MARWAEITEAESDPRAGGRRAFLDLKAGPPVSPTSCSGTKTLNQLCILSRILQDLPAGQIVPFSSCETLKVSEQTRV